MTSETENPEIDNETKLRREKIYWSLRFVMVPISISLIAGGFAIAVINQQIEGRASVPVTVFTRECGPDG